MRKPAPGSQFPTQDTGLVSLPLKEPKAQILPILFKEPKAQILPILFKEPNVTSFTYPIGRQCPNGYQQGNEQNAPSPGGQSNGSGNSNQSNGSGGDPPEGSGGEQSDESSQSNNAGAPGGDPPRPDSDPEIDPDPDSDPDSDSDYNTEPDSHSEPDLDSECPLGEPYCPICFYFERRRRAIFGTRGEGRRSPNMDLLFNEPIITTARFQDASLNVFGPNFAGPSNVFITSASTSQERQTFRRNFFSVGEQSASSRRSLLPNVRIALGQFAESQGPYLNFEFRVPEALTGQPEIREPIPHLLSQSHYRRSTSVTASSSPLQQPNLFSVLTVEAFSPLIQQPVRTSGSQLYQQTPSPLRLDTPNLLEVLGSSESRITPFEPHFRAPIVTPPRFQPLGDPLQQLEHFVMGRPRPSGMSSQIEQVVCPSYPQNVRHVTPQSEASRDTSLQLQLSVPSVTPSTSSQFMDAQAPAFDSPLQQLQYLTRGTPSRPLVFSPPLQQPVRASSCMYERILSLRRPMSDVPNVRNILPRSRTPRDTSFRHQLRGLEVPVCDPEIRRSRTDSSPQFSMSRVSPSQFQLNIPNISPFGSALPQQQYFAFGSQSNLPTVRTTQSQLQQPLHMYGSQLYGRTPPRSSIGAPHTVTMLPRFTEARDISFEPPIKVPNIMRPQRQSSTTTVPAFGSALQQQSLLIRSQSNIPTVQPFRPQLQQQVRTHGSQLYRETHFSLGSLRLPTSRPQSTDTSTLSSPLQQLEYFASRGPRPSNFISQIENIVIAYDPHLYDRTSSFAGSVTDVSDRGHFLPQSETPGIISSRPQLLRPPEIRPALQQEPFLSVTDPSNVTTAPVFISQLQHTVRAKVRPQRKRSSTESLIRIPSVRAALPHPAEPKSPADDGLKRKDSFSVASLLDLPDTPTEEPRTPLFEQQSNEPRAPPFQPIIPQSDVSRVRPSQPQLRDADLPAFGFPLQQQPFLPLSGQSNVPEREAQIQQPGHGYGILGSCFDVPKVETQSTEPKYTSFEPRFKTPSAVPSRSRSNIPNVPAFGSALQQQQYFAFGSPLNVPTAQTTPYQLQQSVHSYGSRLYGRTPLRRRSIDLPHTVTTLPQSPEPRDTLFESSIRVPTATRSQLQSSTTTVPTFGSALQQQQQQYLVSGSQSNVPTPRTTPSQLQQPVHIFGSQSFERSLLRRQSIDKPHTVTMSSQFGSRLYGRTPLRRSSIDLPHTVTTLPQSPEPRDTSIEPPVKVPRMASSQPRRKIKSVPRSPSQGQQSLAVGGQLNIPTLPSLIGQLEQSVPTRDSQPSYEQMSQMSRSVSSLFVRLPPFSDPKDTLDKPKFGETRPISSQPPPTYRDLQFGSPPQQQALLPFSGLSSIPEEQNIPLSSQQHPPLVRLHFDAPNAQSILPRLSQPVTTSLEPNIMVTRVPGYRPQLSGPIALSLPYLDLPKVSNIGPQLKAHEESAFRAVTPPSRSDTIFDVGNLRGAGLPELRNRRANLRFGKSRPYPIPRSE